VHHQAAVYAQYNLVALADDAIGVLDHYGVESAHVIGASMGGVVAQIVGTRHTDRCSSLSLIMTAERIGEAMAATSAASDGAFMKALGAATRVRPHPRMSLDEYLSLRERYWQLMSTDDAFPELSSDASAEAIEIDTADFERGGIDWHGFGASRQTLAIIEWERRHAGAHRVGAPPRRCSHGCAPRAMCAHARDAWAA